MVLTKGKPPLDPTGPSPSCKEKMGCIWRCCFNIGTWTCPIKRIWPSVLITAKGSYKPRYHSLGGQGRRTALSLRSACVIMPGPVFKKKSYELSIFPWYQNQRSRVQSSESLSRQKSTLTLMQSTVESGLSQWGICYFVLRQILPCPSCCRNINKIKLAQTSGEVLHDTVYTPVQKGKCQPQNMLTDERNLEPILKKKQT